MIWFDVIRVSFSWNNISLADRFQGRPKYMLQFPNFNKIAIYEQIRQRLHSANALSQI